MGLSAAADTTWDCQLPRVGQLWWVMWKHRGKPRVSIALILDIHMEDDGDEHDALIKVVWCGNHITINAYKMGYLEVKWWPLHLFLTCPENKNSVTNTYCVQENTNIAI